MPVAAKNLLFELLSVFALVFSILILVSVGGRFSGYVEEVVNGRIPIELLWTVLVLRLPEFVVLVIPLGLFLSIVVTLGRYHSEQEFSVLVMGGLSPLRLFGWLASIVVPLTLIVAFLSFWVTPDFVGQFEKIMSETKASDSINQLPANVVKTFDNGKKMVFVKGIDTENHQLDNIVYGSVDGPHLEFATAQSINIAEYTELSTRALLLTNGEYLTLDLETGDLLNAAFEEFQHRIDKIPVVAKFNESSIHTVNLDLSKPSHLSEFQWRVSLPIMTLIVSLLGIGIAKVPPRRGRYSQIAPGLTLFVLYIASVVIGRNMTDWMPALGAYALTILHLVFLIFGLVLLRKSWLPT